MAKKRGRRRGRVWIAAVPLIALAVWLVLFNYVFVIREVTVRGAGSVPAQEVMRLSDIRLGTRMSRLDVEAVRDGVEADGRLAFVSAEKSYPNSVLLTVRERTRDALIVQAGKVLVLDSDGYVISIDDRLPEASMPYVTGLKASSYQLGRQLDTEDGRIGAMRTVLEALKARGVSGYVSELSVEDIRNLRIVTRTGMTVELGDSTNMDNKIIWMAGAIRDLESRGELAGRLDVASGSKADYRPGASPTPSPTPDPLLNAEDVWICGAVGCNKEGVYSIVGMSGTTEHYCYEHYLEVQAILQEVYGDDAGG